MRHHLFIALAFMGLAASPLSATASTTQTSSTVQGSTFQIAEASTGITEAEVKVLLARMQAAAKAHNADKLLSYFTPDAKIVAQMPEEMGGRMTLDPQLYKNLLQKGWSVLKGKQYTYDVKNIQIKVFPGKDKAMVSDETHESFRLNNETITSVTHQQMLIVRHQGQLKVKVLKGQAAETP